MAVPVLIDPDPEPSGVSAESLAFLSQLEALASTINQSLHAKCQSNPIADSEKLVALIRQKIGAVGNLAAYDEAKTNSVLRQKKPVYMVPHGATADHVEVRAKQCPTLVLFTGPIQDAQRWCGDVQLPCDPYLYATSAMSAP